MRSGRIGGNAASSLAATFSGAGTFAFDWKVSSEYGFDFLTVTVDGETPHRISGEVDWTEIVLEFTNDAVHTVVWTYAKDATTDRGADCGWVDQVVWTPAIFVQDGAGGVRESYASASWLVSSGLVGAADDDEAIVEKAKDDNDGDGYTNEEEALLGTDPNDPDSKLEIGIENVDGLMDVTYAPENMSSEDYALDYRIMGQGGAVMDFTDYGAKPLRCYVPEANGDLVNVIKAKANVIDCEKAGELAEVWKMTPIRRPGATGLVFELPDGRAVSMKPPQTIDVSAVQSNNQTIKQFPRHLLARRFSSWVPGFSQTHRCVRSPFRLASGKSQIRPSVSAARLQMSCLRKTLKGLVLPPSIIAVASKTCSSRPDLRKLAVLHSIAWALRTLCLNLRLKSGLRRLSITVR